MKSRIERPKVVHRLAAMLLATTGLAPLIAGFALPTLAGRGC